MVWILLGALAFGGEFALSPELDIAEQAVVERINGIRSEPQVLQEIWGGARYWPGYVRACADPIGEVLAELDGIPARPPLAPNELLIDAARSWGAHRVAGTLDGTMGPNQRLLVTGFPLPVNHDDPRGLRYLGDPDANEVEGFLSVPIGQWSWLNAVDLLFLDPCDPERRTRDVLLGERPTELGLAMIPSADAVALEVITATRVEDQHYVIGVVYVDLNGNGVPDAGEEQPEVEVALGDYSWTRTAQGGGYVLPAPGWPVDLSGGDQEIGVGEVVTNTKLDLSIAKGPGSDGQGASVWHPPTGAELMRQFVDAEAFEEAEEGPPELSTAERLQRGAWLLLFLIPMIVVIIGVTSSTAFDERARVRIAGDEDAVTYADAVALKGKRRMFRNARVGLTATGEIVDVIDEAVVCVFEATAKGILLRPVKDLELMDLRSRSWKPAEVGLARRARVYRVEPIYFVFRQ